MLRFHHSLSNALTHFKGRQQNVLEMTEGHGTEGVENKWRCRIDGGRSRGIEGYGGGGEMGAGQWTRDLDSFHTDSDNKKVAAVLFFGI